MEQISIDEGVTQMLDSLLNGRLVLLAGAGLSIPWPSSLPSAGEIAQKAKQRYDAMHGATREPLSGDIESQAEYFFTRGELDSVYFESLIDQHDFCGPPNEGHYAVADLLITRALPCAVTTNVDTLIETAGQLMYGAIAAVTHGQAASALTHNVSPLLKIHGCRVKDRPNMVWAPGQIVSEPVSTYIGYSKTWLQNNLVNRDILIVGFWTDWSYLNTTLAACLDTVNPSRVVVVSPDDTAEFSEKAPELYSLGERSTNSFQHVKASGNLFLDELRKTFSHSYIRRVLHSGSEDYADEMGSPPEAAWLEPTENDCATLWQIRRDLEGRLPNQPAQDRDPPNNESLVGLTLLQLRSGGAGPDGAYWEIDGKRVRVIRAVNKLLHKVEAEFEGDLAPAVAPDLVIAVGAESHGLAKNLVRPNPKSTVARGQRSRWVTRQEGMQELGL